SPLTPREQDVAALVAKGMSNRQIASALGRSPRTVDGHVENILAKLGFGSRARIASWWTANQASTP
ncbi:response regulator transcription factor, partial [Streptomyces europaeiscabiei]